MKKDILTAIVLVSPVLFSNCGTRLSTEPLDIPSVSIRPAWPDKSSFDLKVITSAWKGFSGEQTATADVHVELSKNSDHSWTCLWTVEDIIAPVNNDLAEKLVELAVGMKYEVILDSVGEVREFVNWRENQVTGYKALAEILKVTDRDRAGARLSEQFRSIAGKMLGTRESMEMFLLKDLKIYFGLGAVNIERNDTVLRPSYLMHPFTNQVVMADQKVVFTDAYTDSTCQIMVIQNAGGDQLLTAMTDAVNNVNEMVGKTRQAPEYDMGFSLTSRYRVSANSGTVYEVVFEKKVRINSDENRERVKIVRS